MIAEDRKTIRQNFSMLLTVSLDNAKVYSGQVADFGGQSPVVIVSGAGSEHDQVTPDLFVSKHNIDVFVFVLYKDEAANWNEMDAENMLDDIEHKIHQVVMDNQHGEYWNSISYRSPSTETPAPAMIGGAEYKVEIISLTFS